MPYPLPSYGASVGDPFGGGPAAGSFTNDPLPDYPVYDAATGQYVSRKTRRPYTGTYNGQNFTAGAAQPTAAQKAQQEIANINPNDPTQRYKPVNVVKQPDVAGAQQDLMKEFTSTASSALKGFTDYLNNFKTDIAGARAAGAAATDIAPTTAALTQAQQRYSGSLDASNAAYQKALADAAANTRGVVAQAQGMLPQYNQAVTNIENTQLGQLQNLVSRYKLGTGTPTSLGTDEQRLLLNAAQSVAQPFELAKINKGYDILTDMALPVEQQIGGQNISYAGSYLPAIAGQQYGSATDLAKTVQALKQSVAGLSMQQALSYLQAAGVPSQIIQQVLSGQITNLGGLSQLETGANYQGLQDLLGYNLTQPVGGYPAMPSLPTYRPSYYPPTTGTSPLASNAPATVAPAGAPASVLPVGAPDTATGGYALRSIPQFGTPQYNQWLNQQALSNPDVQNNLYQTALDWKLALGG